MYVLRLIENGLGVAACVDTCCIIILCLGTVL